MRDVFRPGVTDAPSNGAVLEMEEPSGSTPAVARSIRRDKQLAEVAVLLIDTARMIEPIVGMLSGKALRWAALGLSSWLAFYALQHPSWERLAILGAFMLASPLIWWKA